MTVFHSANNDFEGTIEFWCKKRCRINWSILEDDIFDLDFDEDKVSCGLLGNVCPVNQLAGSLFLVLTAPFWVPNFLIGYRTGFLIGQVLTLMNLHCIFSCSPLS